MHGCSKNHDAKKPQTIETLKNPGCARRVGVASAVWVHQPPEQSFLLFYFFLKKPKLQRTRPSPEVGGLQSLLVFCICPLSLYTSFLESW